MYIILGIRERMGKEGGGRGKGSKRKVREGNSVGKKIKAEMQRWLRA